MNRTQAIGILTALVGLDPRHKSGDETTAQAKEALWIDMLADVDPEWCFDLIKRKHRTDRKYPLSIGEIVGEWDHLESRRNQPSLSGPDDQPTPDRIAEIRRAAGLPQFRDPKTKQNRYGGMT